MRCLQVNKFFYRAAGAETYFFDVATLLSSHGWDVIPFAMQHPRNEPTPYAQYFAPFVDYQDATMSLGRRAGAAVDLIYNRHARRNLAALLAATKPDVAHVHNIYHQLSPSILPVLRDAGLRVVMTMHDLKLLCPNYRMVRAGRVCERCRGGHYHECVIGACSGSYARSLLNAIEAWLHNVWGVYRDCIDVIATPSRFYATLLRRWEFDRVRVVPCHFPLRAAEQSFPTEDYAAYFGRIVPEKGVRTLVAAAEAFPHLRFKIAGRGDGLDGMTLPPNVELVGFLSGVALARFIGAARFSLCPSEWYENLPYAVLESYMAGRPVIGARIGGIPEIIDDGVTGVLFEPGNVADLRRRIAEVLDTDAQTLSIMGRRGRDKILTEHNPHNHYRELQELYAVNTTDEVH